MRKTRQGFEDRGRELEISGVRILVLSSVTAYLHCITSLSTAAYYVQADREAVCLFAGVSLNGNKVHLGMHRHRYESSNSVTNLVGSPSNRQLPLGVGKELNWFKVGRGIWELK